MRTLNFEPVAYDVRPELDAEEAMLAELCCDFGDWVEDALAREDELFLAEFEKGRV